MDEEEGTVACDSCGLSGRWFWEGGDILDDGSSPFEKVCRVCSVKACHLYRDMARAYFLLAADDSQRESLAAEVLDSGSLAEFRAWMESAEGRGSGLVAHADRFRELVELDRATAPGYVGVGLPLMFECMTRQHVEDVQGAEERNALLEALEVVEDGVRRVSDECMAEIRERMRQWSRAEGEEEEDEDDES